MTVIQYVLKRLHDIGVRDIFGVPGDYAFPVNDAICLDEKIRWIGCCNRRSSTRSRSMWRISSSIQTATL